MRTLAILAIAFLSTSCIGWFPGDSMQSTEYVITSGKLDRVDGIIRRVAAANALKLFRHRHPEPHYPYREYTNWAPGGQVSIWLTLDTRAPFLISITETYTSRRSDKHRQIA